MAERIYPQKDRTYCWAGASGKGAEVAGTPACAGGRADGNGCDGLRAGLAAASAEPVVSCGTPGSAFMMLTGGIEDADGKNRLLGVRTPATGAGTGAIVDGE